MDHLGLRISPLCALCLFSSAFVSLVVRLCVLLSPSANIVFRVEEILVGAVYYMLLLCIAQSVGGPGRLSNLSPGRRGQPVSLPF